VKKSTIKSITSSILDCECKGDGYLFLKNGKDVKCPIHYGCASSEEYRISLLRLEYQNMRGFVLQMSKIQSTTIDLSLPASSKGVDEMIMANYEVNSPESWVRSIQDYVRQSLLNS
jgi:hypothetical protein